jgi:hypothetical protein
MATTNHLLPDEKEFARMEAELFGRLEHSHTRQVRRHRLVAAAAVVLLAGGGVAGVTEANQPMVSRAAYCYAGPDTNSQELLGQYFDPRLHGGDSPSADLRAKAVEQALRSCGSIWESGLLGAGATAPPLQACVRNDQVIAVFPKNDATPAGEFCDNLGMSAP